MIEVYYAEDDEIIAQSVKEYLEEKNCRVTTFGTLAALRSALRSRIPKFFCWTGICRTGGEANCAAGYENAGRIFRLSS